MNSFEKIMYISFYFCINVPFYCLRYIICFTFEARLLRYKDSLHELNGMIKRRRSQTVLIRGRENPQLPYFHVDQRQHRRAF